MEDLCRGIDAHELTSLYVVHLLAGFLERRTDGPTDDPLGDYTAGPSHVMPTGGTARISSPIHVGEFTKVISITNANERAMRRLGPATATLARAEGLTAHARAIERRLVKLDRE